MSEIKDNTSQSYFQHLSDELETVEKQLVERFTFNNESQNPMQILSRIRALQENLIELDRGVTEIFQAKKEAIDITKNILLLFNRRILHDISQGYVDEQRPEHMNPQDSERQFQDWSQRFLESFVTWQRSRSQSATVDASASSDPVTDEDIE